VTIEMDDLADLADLEAAALAFARDAPAKLVAAAVEALVDDLLDAIIGPLGLPLTDADQAEAPWSCTRCASTRGFRRRGLRPGGRRVTCAVGEVTFKAQQVICRSCGLRFVPVLELLGLRRHQRSTDAVADLAAGLAVEVAYAKASRLLADLAGIEVSPRSLRRQVLSLAPERLGPEVAEVPVLLLDGTGVRAGTTKLGVGLHLAIALVARTREAGRVVVEARLLGATLGEGWPVMAELLAGVRPGLVIVDGEEELSTLAATVFPGVPVQRCLFHLAKGVAKAARYSDGASATLTDDFSAQLRRLLSDAYRHGDEAKARTAYDDLIDDLLGCGAPAAAAHLEGARHQALTFLTHPGAGRLFFGDKGYPELGTGVLERVMREMNRRTDVGVRWSVKGVRGILMVKLGIKYRHGRWAPAAAPAGPAPVRFSLVT
jgi:hypothetical protein